MSQFISPGVYTLEKDLSQYVSDLSATIVAMVGTSDKGPSNTPTLITSAKQFVDVFGQPNPNHYMGYAAGAYLKQGNTLYVNRVTAADAAIAKITTPVPATYKPYAGSWVLTSQTDTTATFTISNTSGAAAADQLVALQDAAYVLKGFDFTDSTQLEPTKGKLGSDLKSFVTAGTDVVSSYIKGRKFKITSGPGKDSSVPVLDLADLATPSTTLLDLTVNSTKFNTFNSPTLATATGTLVSTAVGATPADLALLAVIGATNTGGTIKLQFHEALDFDTTLEKDNLVTSMKGSVAGAQTNLEKLVSVSGTDAIIQVPLYHTGTAGTSIAGTDMAKNADMVASILTAIISSFRDTVVTLGTNMSGIAGIAKANASSGIIGLGTFDVLTGASTGIKSAEVQADTVTIKLSAISVGALGNYTTTGSTTLVATPTQISGNFALDTSRPTWVMSMAGTANVPTLFKFSSKGEADLSNMAVVTFLDTNNLDSNKEQQYSVALYSRLVADNVAVDSQIQSDFTLVEQFEGSSEVLQSKINTNSAYIYMKLDYSTSDLVDYGTGAITYVGTSPDYLNPSFALASDVTGKGVLSGVKTIVSGTSMVPGYSAFFMGGSVGTTITTYDILGDVAAKTGIYAFSDPEQLDINLLVAPGWSADPGVAKGMVGLCESRGDCMSILDTPFGLSVENVTSFKKNVLNIDSNYAAIYYPWVKITDSYNKKDIFVPPSGLVAGQYAYNDLVGEVFTAPAGRNRGNLTDALATERILNQGDRDMLTLSQINPIHFEAGYGIYIRGQMTLQSATTALDRVNVRRLLLNLRKVIATASKYFEFEPGDSITALRLKQLAESTLEDRLRKGAIRSYKVDVGPTVNTALTLENNELRMSIEVVPTKTAEKIIEVFNILGQGQGISIGA
jgi:phage tail sheath protein FI